MDILLEILLKLCESDVVAAIGCFHFWLDNIKLRSPDACDFDYYVNDEEVERKYELKTDFDAKRNKLAGLYVLSLKVNVELFNFYNLHIFCLRINYALSRFSL